MLLILHHAYTYPKPQPWLLFLQLELLVHGSYQAARNDTKTLALTYRQHAALGCNHDNNNHLSYLLLIVRSILSVVEPALGQLYLPLVVSDEVVEVGQHLFFIVVVPGLGCVFVLVLQSKGVELGTVGKLRPL